MSAFDQTPLRPDAPAFPASQGHDNTAFQSIAEQQARAHGRTYTPPLKNGGLTARQHAAIALCVPDSGTQWLDDMIRARLRDEFAMAALQGMIAGARREESDRPTFSYRYADAALSQREAP